MPLTQLSTLVLPAPFGPISANSCAFFTLSEISSSTVRPPKRKVRRSIASSAIPSPPAAILLDVAITAPFSALSSEIEFLNVRVSPQPFRRAVKHDLSVFHHIAIIGDFKRNRRALLNHEDGEPELAADFNEPKEEIVHHDGSQSQRELIDQQQLRGACQRAAERE